MVRWNRMAKPAKVLLNVPAIKADFPILQRKVHDRRLVYLDSAATSQKPKQVIDATSDFYARYNANVHRAIYELGEEATREYEGAREKIAGFIRAKSPNEIVFTKSTTESLNVVAYGYGLKGKLQPGDEIVGTVTEHHSNHVPWHFVKDHKGAVLKYVDVTDEGTLRMEQYDELITKRTKIVTVTLCSNVLGTINPVKEIAKRAHEVGAVCVVDAAQAAPHMPIDVQSLDADFLAFSGHKMLGPTGIGVLYGKAELLEETEPLLGGGEMIREVHLGWAKWNDVPYKFEGGTPNIAGAIGLDGAGVVLHLQRPGRCRRPDRRHQAGPGGLRLMAVSYEMYQEQILDHYKHPRNKGSLPGATKNARDTNPLCGDEVVLHLKVDGSDRIADVRFEGQGCAISQASASMLTTIVKGMSLGDATALDRDAILKKLGIPLSAVRLKCALLSLHVLKVALGPKPDVSK